MSSQIDALRRERELRRRIVEKANESTLDKIRWNLVQWKVINSKARELYMSGANQVGGKTTTALQIIKQWATNRYPEGYTGIRLRGHERPAHPLIEVVGMTHEKVQEVITDRLFGSFEERGAGAIPASWFDPERDLIPATGGARGQLKQAFLPFFSDDGKKIIGRSQLLFKAYAQGAKNLQNTTADALIMDEEPPRGEEGWLIYEECSARTNATGGPLRLFASPTQGNSKIRKKFKSDNPNFLYVPYNINDCEHITAEHKQELIDKYEGNDRVAMLRLFGEVPEGEDLVFPVNLDAIAYEDRKVKPIEQVCIGIDLSHTASGQFACALVSYDKNLNGGTYRVHSSWKGRGGNRDEYAGHMRRLGGQRIEIAWPHDGGRRPTDPQTTIIQEYARDYGLRFRPTCAMYLDGGKMVFKKEPIVERMYDAMTTGRFQVTRGEPNRQLFEELAEYSAKGGVIGRKQDDHIIDAVIKAIMVVDRCDEYGTATRHVPFNRSGPSGGPMLHREVFNRPRFGRPA